MQHRNSLKYIPCCSDRTDERIHSSDEDCDQTFQSSWQKDENDPHNPEMSHIHGHLIDIRDKIGHFSLKGADFWGQIGFCDSVVDQSGAIGLGKVQPDIAEKSNFIPNVQFIRSFQKHIIHPLCRNEQNSTQKPVKKPGAVVIFFNGADSSNGFVDWQGSCHQGDSQGRKDDGCNRSWEEQDGCERYSKVNGVGSPLVAPRFVNCMVRNCHCNENSCRRNQRPQQRGLFGGRNCFFRHFQRRRDYLFSVGSVAGYFSLKVKGGSS